MLTSVSPKRQWHKFNCIFMVIIDPNFEDSIVKRVSEEYLKAFPSLTGKYSYHICESADGVKIL